MGTGYPSIDRPWLKYYPAAAINKEIPAKSAYALVYDRHCHDPSLVALEYFGRKITYKKLFASIASVARGLKRLGVKAGDIVTLALPTMPETVYLFYALNRLGAAANVIDPRLTAPELARMLRQTGSEVLVTLEMFLPAAEPTLGKTSLKNIILLTPTESLPFFVRAAAALKTKRKTPSDRRILSWGRFLKAGRDCRGVLDAPYKADRPVVIVHTGGTTGAPKGVVLTNENFNTMAVTQEISGYELQEKDTFLTFLPPFIAYCLVNAIHDPLYLGFHNILIPQFDPQDFPALMMRYRPNHVLAGPILWEFFIKSDLTQNADLSFLKSPISGGDVLNLELEKQVNVFLESHGCRHKIAQGYGMTEVSAAACFSTDSSYCPGSVGIPYIKNVIAIFDPETEQELPYGQSGEICIQTPTMMLGYYKDPSATADILRRHRDGKLWVHTGDIGHINPNGNLFVEGRMKRMIVRNGNKIFPAVTEEVIAQHPAISNCVVVQMPDPIERHVPIAHIVLRDGAVPEKAIAEIDQLIAENLPAFHLPCRYILRSTLPLTAINKVDYKKLEAESLQYQNAAGRIIRL